MKITNTYSIQCQEAASQVVKEYLSSQYTYVIVVPDLCPCICFPSVHIHITAQLLHLGVAIGSNHTCLLEH